MTASSRASRRTSSRSGEFDVFERVVRSAHAYTAEDVVRDREPTHPFDERNIHPDIPQKCRALFDDGYYAESVFEAAKFVESVVRRLSGASGNGLALMMKAFDEGRPLIALSSLSTQSEKDEQAGFKFLFAGLMTAIRNPGGHEVNQVVELDAALDYLSLVSILLRRLQVAGFDLAGSR